MYVLLSYSLLVIFESFCMYIFHTPAFSLLPRRYKFTEFLWKNLSSISFGALGLNKSFFVPNPCVTERSGGTLTTL